MDPPTPTRSRILLRLQRPQHLLQEMSRHLSCPSNNSVHSPLDHEVLQSGTRPNLLSPSLLLLLVSRFPPEHSTSTPIPPSMSITLGYAIRMGSGSMSRGWIMLSTPRFQIDFSSCVPTESHLGSQRWITLRSKHAGKEQGDDFL